MKPRVLIVDDEAGILQQLSDILADEGFEPVATASGVEALEIFRRDRPDAVFLDIWLPDKDGLECLREIREIDPHAAVVVISGHGDAPTAAASIKAGAFDYLGKPLAYARVMAALKGALASRDHTDQPHGTEGQTSSRRLAAPGGVPLLVTGTEPQRTLADNTVIYGLGLHSGTRTGLVLQPLPADSGIHFQTLPTGTMIPAFLSSVAETEYATTLSGEGEEIKTVEHLLSALHAAGITNLLVKVHGEIPVLDGSSVELCQRLEEVGIVPQEKPRKELVIDRLYEVRGTGAKCLTIEPAAELSVSYLLRYPPPVGEQTYDFVLSSFAAYREQIAPARTFGFLRDIPMLNELGLGSGGRLDNFILVGEDAIVNTTLRFPDEFVRHKILDIIGDLYLLGYPVRGKVTASLTGHRDNIALQRQILAAHMPTEHAGAVAVSCRVVPEA
jgi:UDP-3-O-acyl N-acetylglucosamine deacetylase